MIGNDQQNNEEHETDKVMSELGYVRIVAVKDHRTVERYEAPGKQLQNVSKQLARLITSHSHKKLLEGKIEVLKGAKEVLGIDRTNSGVTEDFNAGVEQITYVVNATLQGNIDRLTQELKELQ